MSKMTREELTRDNAIEMLERDFELMLQQDIEKAYNGNEDRKEGRLEEAHLCYQLRTTALSILAPEPRTEPPTVEVGERIWMYWESAWDWQLMDTEDAILNWDTGSAPWLPESALPMPKGTL